MTRVARGALVEYAVAAPPLTLAFEFNPETLSRTRTFKLTAGGAPGTRGGYDFRLPTETARVAQGVVLEPETFSLRILLDATGRMNDGDPIASLQGIEPELATLRSLVEPKMHVRGGLSLLASLGAGSERAHARQTSASVILFVWGSHVLPVFLTSVQVEEKAHLPNLVPYRAEVSLSLQVIEGNNPFFQAETARQVALAALNTQQTAVGALAGFGGAG